MTNEEIYKQAIHNFWMYRKNQTITAKEAGLYFYLLHKAYLNKWEQPIGVYYREINAFKLSTKTLEQTLTSLQDKNLIGFTKTEKRKIVFKVNKNLI